MAEGIRGQPITETWIDEQDMTRWRMALDNINWDELKQHVLEYVQSDLRRMQNGSYEPSARVWELFEQKKREQTQRAPCNLVTNTACSMNSSTMAFVMDLCNGEWHEWTSHPPAKAGDYFQYGKTVYAVVTEVKPCPLDANACKLPPLTKMWIKAKFIYVQPLVKQRLVTTR